MAQNTNMSLNEEQMDFLCATLQLFKLFLFFKRGIKKKKYRPLPSTPGLVSESFFQLARAPGIKSLFYDQSKGRMMEDEFVASHGARKEGSVEVLTNKQYGCRDGSVTGDIPVTKPDKLSSIPRIHMLKRKLTPRSCPLVFINMLWCTCNRTYIGTCL